MTFHAALRDGQLDAGVLGEGLQCFELDQGHVADPGRASGTPLSGTRPGACPVVAVSDEAAAGDGAGPPDGRRGSTGERSQMQRDDLSVFHGVTSG